VDKILRKIGRIAQGEKSKDWEKNFTGKSHKTVQKKGKVDVPLLEKLGRKIERGKTTDRGGGGRGGNHARWSSWRKEKGNIQRD